MECRERIFKPFWFNEFSLPDLMCKLEAVEKRGKARHVTYAKVQSVPNLVFGGKMPGIWRLESIKFA